MTFKLKDLEGSDWDIPLSEQKEYAIEPTNKFIKRCSNVFSCACAVGGGFALSHLGCIWSYALTFSGVGLAAGFSASSAALGVSAATTSAGLGLWYSLRGKVADRLEKRITIGSALAGVIVSLALHFNGAVGHIPSAEKSLEFYRSQTPQGQNELTEASGSQSFMEFLMSICESTPKP